MTHVTRGRHQVGAPRDDTDTRAVARLKQQFPELPECELEPIAGGQGLRLDQPPVELPTASVRRVAYLARHRA